jgi:hypothetical protein
MRLAPILLAAVLFGQPNEPDPASLEGQVLHAVTGAPVRKVLVTAQSVSVAHVTPVRSSSDAHGRFKFAKLTPGDYGLVVRVHDVRPGTYVLRVGLEQTSSALSPDEQSFVAVYYPNPLDARSATPVVMAAGQQMRGVRRVRFAAIRGRIVAPEDAQERTVELRVREEEFWSGPASGIQDPEGKNRDLWCTAGLLLHRRILWFGQRTFGGADAARG